MEIDPHQTEFFVPGDPVPQSRPRITRNGHAYYAQRIVAYRKSVAMAARSAGVPLRTGPLSLGIVFVFARPRSHLLKNGKLAKNATSHPFARGDLTNLCKGVEDSLNQIAYADDSQVVDLTMSKKWADDETKPGAYITICEMYPLPQVIKKRSNSVKRQWSKTERSERDARASPDIHRRRVIAWKDTLGEYLHDDFDKPVG